MKNSNYIISGILAVAVIVLFILQFTGRKGDTKSLEVAGAITNSTGSHLPVAFIRTDSLMAKYKFFIDLSNDLLKKQEDKTLIIKQRDDQLKKDIADFYQKVQNNVFISQERAQQEQSRLEGRQQDLQKLVAQSDREMSIEQAKTSQQLQDTIIAALKIFNTPRKYELIFANAGTDNILYADDSYDITNEVVAFLNARYVPAKK